MAAWHHLVWDWNGTLLDDLDLVVAATNASLASVGGPSSHGRRAPARLLPAADRVLRQGAGPTGRPSRSSPTLDRAFHDAYRAGLAECRLAADALTAIGAWSGSQSLLSMFFHHELVPVVERHGLVEHLRRVDGLRDPVGGGSKAPHLRAHLAALSVAGAGLRADRRLGRRRRGGGRGRGPDRPLRAAASPTASRLRATGLPVATTLVEAVALAAA